MEDNEQGLGKSVLDALDVFDKRSYPKHYLHQRASLYESGTQNTLEKIDWNHATTNDYRMLGGAINHCNAPTFIRIIAILLAAVVREPNRMQGIGGHLFLYDFFNREELE